MRSNDIGVVVIVLAVGFLLGVFSTLTVYSSVAGRRLDELRTETETQVEEIVRERDEARAAITTYLEQEKRQREVLEQGVGDEPARPTRPAVAQPARPQERPEKPQ